MQPSNTEYVQAWVTMVISMVTMKEILKILINQGLLIVYL